MRQDAILVASVQRGAEQQYGGDPPGDVLHKPDLLATNSTSV